MFLYTTVCQMEPKIGKCRAKLRRWYFDNSSKSCMGFIYGGCDGNENNFFTEKECNEACKK